jgi:hypothetical protein
MPVGRLRVSYSLTDMRHLAGSMQVTSRDMLLVCGMYVDCIAVCRADQISPSHLTCSHVNVGELSSCNQLVYRSQ